MTCPMRCGMPSRDGQVICARKGMFNMFDKEGFTARVKAAGSVGIAGHIRPDGDCVGSVLAMYGYLKDNFGVEAAMYLEEVPPNLAIIEGSSLIETRYPDAVHDVFIVLDCGEISRLGKAEKYLKKAGYTYCIDHHRTNTGFGDESIVRPEASATCEILFELFGEECISRHTAEALYMGIVHDTGVFKHSSTTRRTMEVAGALLDKGVSSTDIIDGSFYEKTYLQNQILGRCLMESILCMDGRVIIASVDRKVQALYGLEASDTDGVIDQLRVTKGVEVAILLKEMNPRVWRVSIRSCNIVDVATVCETFGGGGHIRAAGCILTGSLHDVINNLTREIEKQMV